MASKSPCRSADRQPGRVRRVPAMEIHRATRYVFDSPEHAAERFGDVLPSVRTVGNVGDARRRTIRVRMRWQSSRDGSVAAGMLRDHSRRSSGTEALDDISRDLEGALTKAAG